MRRFIAWLREWKETLYIKYRQPELYAELTRPLDMGDFGEVPRP